TSDELWLGGITLSGIFLRTNRTSAKCQAHATNFILSIRRDVDVYEPCRRRGDGRGNRDSCGLYARLRRRYSVGTRPRSTRTRYRADDPVLNNPHFCVEFVCDVESSRRVIDGNTVWRVQASSGRGTTVRTMAP